ncbi:MAG TPA: sigma-70 family RNA polymerase sigma factor [Planctomycetota bacterium]|nr:sigma-70 family RNA polymerase sigma factor [Planctomycetota bacterium]
MTTHPRRDPEPPLDALLERHRASLLRAVERRASGLLRFESAEDLVQGIHLRALRVADRLEYRGEKAFYGWLLKVAQQHIADRHEYWSARKRDGGRMLRITACGTFSSSKTGAVSPAAQGTGASTLASRKEELAIAARAVALLLPRDQELVRYFSEGLSVAETAGRIGISGDAAERARLRALDRFRKTFELLSRAGVRPEGRARKGQA